jgi:glycosyltransferase involved in cell wall biosynthesis
MKISGFTFVRNAVVFCYPMLESLNSLAPVCDEIIIAAGESDDETVSILKNLNEPKIQIIDTAWDNSLRSGGRIYAQQTNIALQECSGDWCLYLQADEVFHEKDYDKIVDEIIKADKDPEIDGLLFRYTHFYGSYKYIGTGRQWYKREVRAFRNTGNIASWGDAQGFRKSVASKFVMLNVKQTDIDVFHYGWVRPPKAQNKKYLNSRTYYHQGEEFDINDSSIQEFDYKSAFELEVFRGSHPAIMNEKIENDSEWTKNFDPSQLRKKPFLVAATDWIEKKTGYRIGEYKDFRIIK